MVCIRLVCYDLRGKRGPCDEKLHELQWSPQDLATEMCVGFGDALMEDFDTADFETQEDLLDDLSYESREELESSVRGCCDDLMNAIVAGRCDPTPSQMECLGTAASLAPWFEDEDLDEGAALLESCEPVEEPQPFEPYEVVLPIQEPHPGDSPSNPIFGVGQYDRGPYRGVDGLWYRILGVL